MLIRVHPGLFPLLRSSGFPAEIGFLGPTDNRHPPLRRFAPVALLYFVLVAIVGNVYEARTLGEIVVILYLPVALGCRRYLAGADATPRADARPGATPSCSRTWPVWKPPPCSPSSPSPSPPTSC